MDSEGLKRAAEETAEQLPAKSQRTSSGTDDSNTDSSKEPCPSLLPALPLEEAFGLVKKVCGVDVALGTRLEVSWEVVEDSADADDKDEVTAEAADAEPEHVWWGCKLLKLVGSDQGKRPVWRLAYDAKVLEGKEFAPEERNVIFCGESCSTSIKCVLKFSRPFETIGKNMLIDLESSERGVGGGDVGLMQWRVEGSSEELPALLPVGLRCVSGSCNTFGCQKHHV